MSDKSKISWTDATWNPVRGCSRVSRGCERCYAEREVYRMGRNPVLGDAYAGLVRKTAQGPSWTGEVRTVPELLSKPLLWKQPRRIFVSSLSDLFHPSVPAPFIAQVFEVMSRCPQHTFQILTKRAEKMFAVVSELFQWAKSFGAKGPLPNVWLGVSVEDRRAAEERIPWLLKTPATVRFLSCEPLLEELDLGAWLYEARPMSCPRCGRAHVDTGEWAGRPHHRHLCALCGLTWAEPSPRAYGALSPRPRVDWVICGGESGARRREMDPTWARSLKDQCFWASVPFFFKQSSGARSETAPWIVEEDGSRWEWRQFPGALTEPVRV